MSPARGHRDTGLVAAKPIVHYESMFSDLPRDEAISKRIWSVFKLLEKEATLLQYLKSYRTTIMLYNVLGRYIP